MAVVLSERFIAKTVQVDRGYAPDGVPSLCWEWRGCINSAGQPLVRHDGKVVTAYRVACAAGNEMDLDDMRGLVARHRCDWPLCVNPDHLLPGTQKENVEDMIERGRLRNGASGKLADTVSRAELVAAIRANR